MTLKDEPSRSVGAQMLLEKSGEIAPERMKKVTGDESKVQCYKEHCCIETWNVRSMNQGKLEMVKQAMARVSIDILNQ